MDKQNFKCKHCGHDKCKKIKAYDAARDFGWPPLKVWVFQCNRCGGNHRLDGSLIDEPDTEVP